MYATACTGTHHKSMPIRACIRKHQMSLHTLSLHGPPQDIYKTVSLHRHTRICKTRYLFSDGDTTLALSRRCCTHQETCGAALPSPLLELWAQPQQPLLPGLGPLAVPWGALYRLSLPYRSYYGSSPVQRCTKARRQDLTLC